LILIHVVKMLQGPLGDSEEEGEDEGGERRFLQAEAHTLGKINLIKAYKETAACKALFEDNIDRGWLFPSLLDHLGTTKEIEVMPNVFTFDAFSDQLCDILVAELDNFELTKLPKRRPNSMNNYGLVINDIGLAPWVDQLVDTFLRPLAEKLFPTEVVALGLDHQLHRAQGGDVLLDMHHDAAEITVNICLGSDFAGSGLRFRRKNSVV
jgi:hypothetical protein